MSARLASNTCLRRGWGRSRGVSSVVMAQCQAVLPHPPRGGKRWTSPAPAVDKPSQCIGAAIDQVACRRAHLAAVEWVKPREVPGHGSQLCGPPPADGGGRRLGGARLLGSSGGSGSGQSQGVRQFERHWTGQNRADCSCQRPALAPSAPRASIRTNSIACTACAAHTPAALCCAPLCAASRLGSAATSAAAGSRKVLAGGGRTARSRPAGRLQQAGAAAGSNINSSRQLSQCNENQDSENLSIAHARGCKGSTALQGQRTCGAPWRPPAAPCPG